MTQHEFFNTAEAAAYLGGIVPVETLKQYRCRNRGPRYVKTPNGKVRYRRDWLDAFIAQHTVTPSETTSTIERAGA